MTTHTAIEGEEEITNPGERQGSNKWAVAAFFSFSMAVMLLMVYLFYTNQAQPTQTITTSSTPQTPKTVAIPENVKSKNKAEAKQFGFTAPAHQEEPAHSVTPAPPPKAASITIDKSRSPLGGGDKGGTALMPTTTNNGSERAAMDFYQQQINALNQTQGAGPMRDAPSLEASLKGTETPVAMASVLPHRNVLLTKGTFIDCVLNTAINSSVAGMTKCTLSRNIYSDNGNTLLLERGSIVTGEYRANLTAGQARLFVLWDRVKTPHGIVVDLSSPSTDPLGGSGAQGYVDNHFWQRYGGAMMLSLVDDFAAYATGSSGDSAITLQNSSQAAQNAATEALKNTINIPPTLRKNQGDRIGIFVARDIDFSNVYQLRLTQ